MYENGGFILLMTEPLTIEWHGCHKCFWTTNGELFGDEAFANKSLDDHAFVIAAFLNLMAHSRNFYWVKWVGAMIST